MIALKRFLTGCIAFPLISFVIVMAIGKICGTIIHIISYVQDTVNVSIFTNITPKQFANAYGIAMFVVSCIIAGGCTTILFFELPWCVGNKNTPKN